MQLRTNANQVIRGLTQKILNPETLDIAVRSVATTMLAEMKTRVFEEGGATSGDIGKYSTKPLYVSINANPGKSFGQPTGKTGKSKFTTGKKAGQSHTSKYFQRGYDEYKSAIGRNIGKVNLFLSGQFSQQMTVLPTPKGYGLGWTNTEMFNRAGAFTKKYKRIWGLTENETELAKSLAKKYFLDAISE